MEDALITGAGSSWRAKMPMKTSKIGKNKRPAFSGTVHKEIYQTLPDNMNEPDWRCERCAGRDAKPEDEPGADRICGQFPDEGTDRAASPS